MKHYTNLNFVFELAVASQKKGKTFWTPAALKVPNEMLTVVKVVNYSTFKPVTLNR